MKHAGSATLSALEPLLARLRVIPGLVERTPGSFYFKSRAFLHFHEDPTGTFADVKLDRVSFERLPVTTRLQQLRLLRRITTSLAKS